MNRLLNYDKDNIPPKVIKHVKTYYDDEEFTPTVVERVSRCQVIVHVVPRDESV